MLRKVGIAQKKLAFDFDFWIIGGIFMKKFVAGVVALTIAFGGMALPAESGFSAVSANAEEMSEANVDVQAADDVKIAGDSFVYGDFHYQILDDGNVEITKYSGTDEKVVIPSAINGKKVTSTGEWAFDECRSLTSITIPDSVKSIGEFTFSSCTGLTSVTIGNGVTSIGGAAFNGCTGLTSVTIPNSVKSIGMNAFTSCSSLKSVTIGNSVATIEEGAFGYCTSLTNVTIPDSTVRIDSGAFLGCSSLTNITVGSKNKNYSSENGILFNKDKTELCAYPTGDSRKEYKIPDSVTSIGNDAFSYCTNLVNITISDSVKSIGEYAFCHCENLTSIKIPDGVTSIENFTFSYCTNLTSVIIPDSVNSIAVGAFSECTSLTSVKMPSSLSEIGGAAFSKCSSLKNITIPDGVSLINSSAFEYCTSLTEISIPNTVTCIASESFRNCENLKKVTIPSSVVVIDYYAFVNCPSIKDVYYKGTKKDWNKITINAYNDELINATIHYSNDELTVDKVKTTKFTCTDKAVKINWEKVNGAAGYRVYAYNAKTKKWSKAATVSASTLSFKQTGLKSGTTYKYKVKAYAKQSGKTYWGEASDTMTTTTKPAQPAIKSTSASTSAIRLNWNAVSGANGYRVVRYDANAKKWVSVGTIKTTSFKETKLKGKTSYKYKVKAYRKVGGATYWSEYSAVKSVKTK